MIWGWTYNLYFHSCAKYPGPLLFRMSILPNLYYAWKGTKHLKADELHKIYGMSYQSPRKRNSILRQCR